LEPSLDIQPSRPFDVDSRHHDHLASPSLTPNLASTPQSAVSNSGYTMPSHIPQTATNPISGQSLAGYGYRNGSEVAMRMESSGEEKVRKPITPPVRRSGKMVKDDEGHWVWRSNPD